jgi:hypothetical protein
LEVEYPEEYECTAKIARYMFTSAVELLQGASDNLSFARLLDELELTLDANVFEGQGLANARGQSLNFDLRYLFTRIQMAGPTACLATVNGGGPNIAAYLDRLVHNPELSDAAPFTAADCYGWPAGRARDLTPEQQLSLGEIYSVYQAFAVQDIVTWTVLHEVGHLALGHDGSVSKQRELEADAWAMEAFDRLGGNHYFIEHYLRYRAMRDEALGVPAIPSHPAFAERMDRVAAFGQRAGSWQPPQIYTYVLPWQTGASVTPATINIPRGIEDDKLHITMVNLGSSTSGITPAVVGLLKRDEVYYLAKRVAMDGPTAWLELRGVGQPVVAARSSYDLEPGPDSVITFPEWIVSGYPASASVLGAQRAPLPGLLTIAPGPNAGDVREESGKLLRPALIDAGVPTAKVEGVLDILMAVGPCINEQMAAYNFGLVTMDDALATMEACRQPVIAAIAPVPFEKLEARVMKLERVQGTTAALTEPIVPGNQRHWKLLDAMGGDEACTQTLRDYIEGTDMREAALVW